MDYLTTIFSLDKVSSSPDNLVFFGWCVEETAIFTIFPSVDSTENSKKMKPIRKVLNVPIRYQTNIRRLIRQIR